MLKKYTYHPYQSTYPLIAQQEIALLQAHFPQAVIEHFGSTAIPGMGGKGIIDIYLVVDKSAIAQTKTAIEQLGYQHKPKGGVANQRWFFQQDKLLSNKKSQRFHLHLTDTHNQNVKDCIAFRDYLRSHPQDAAAYDAIKLQAIQAASCHSTKEAQTIAYAQTKAPLIQAITQKINSKP